MESGVLPSMGSQRVGQDLVSEQQFCWSGLVVVSSAQARRLTQVVPPREERGGKKLTTGGLVVRNSATVGACLT